MLAHLFTLGYLQMVHGQSDTHRSVQPPCSFIHNCNPMLADTGTSTQTLTPMHKCVHTHIYTCICSLCIHVWEVPVRRMCVLIKSPQKQARIHNSIQGQACEYTQVLLPTYPCRSSHVCWEDLGIQVALLFSSIVANRPSLFWFGPKIWGFESLPSCS